MAELFERSAWELKRSFAQAEVSATEILEAFLQRIEQVEPVIRAFLRLDTERARERALALDTRRAQGAELGPLAGVPIAIKDNIAIAGRELTCGSKVLGGYRSPYSATAVERLMAADAVVLGQTNMDEFGMGSSCEASSFYATRNPWDLERVPGGSSGGSAAAVAAREAPLAFGSDTGGSIRQPAALCGVVGLKPTYGRVSRYGLVAFASSLDQIGPIATDVRDAALGLSAIAGADPHDSTASSEFVDDYLVDLEEGISGWRVGVLREVDASELSEDVAKGWHGALGRLEELGAELLEVSIPAIRAAVAVYYVVANCEASANLSRFDGVRYGYRDQDARTLDGLFTGSRSAGFGDEVKRRIMLGTFALSSGYYDAYYGRARAVQRALRQELMRALDEVDVLATPTSPTAAFKLGEKLQDPLQMYLSDVFTTPASLAGVPALAVPCGFESGSLPVSLQLIGRPFSERRLLRAGRAFEGTGSPASRSRPTPTIVSRE